MRPRTHHGASGCRQWGREEPEEGTQPGDEADNYGLKREDANERRGASWWVSLRRRGHRIVRLFKDSVYGSDEAAYKAARAYRDAIIEAIPPATNHEQAVLLRKNNQSGISGVRRIETREGDAWQATLMTNDGQKRENFTVSKFGELAAKSMAIAQRRKWLAALPVTHLAYADHAVEVAQEHFADDLIPVSDVMPETHLTADEIEARIQSINDEFDKARPKRLRVRVNIITVAGSRCLFPMRASQLNENLCRSTHEDWKSWTF